MFQNGPPRRIVFAAVESNFGISRVLDIWKGYCAHVGRPRFSASGMACSEAAPDPIRAMPQTRFRTRTPTQIRTPSDRTTSAESEKGTKGRIIAKKVSAKCKNNCIFGQTASIGKQGFFDFRGLTNAVLITILSNVPKIVPWDKGLKKDRPWV